MTLFVAESHKKNTKRQKLVISATNATICHRSFENLQRNNKADDFSSTTKSSEIEEQMTISGDFRCGWQ